MSLLLPRVKGSGAGDATRLNVSSARRLRRRPWSSPWSASRRSTPSRSRGRDLDNGARVHIVHGDVARGGHVLVNIRKFTGIPFASLGDHMATR